LVYMKNTVEEEQNRLYWLTLWFFLGIVGTLFCECLCWCVPYCSTTHTTSVTHENTSQEMTTQNETKLHTGKYSDETV
jgi:hypothetical protein